VTAARGDVEGQLAVIVGAGGGIGAAIATELASRGARLALYDLDETACESTASSIGGEVHFGVLDLEDDFEVERAVSAFVSDLGPPQILVNAAGIAGPTGVESHEMPIAEFDRVMRVNLRGAFVLGRAILPFMVNEGYGRIVHIASIAGKEGNPGMVGYTASKAGLIGMVKAQGKEYARTGVTVNAVAPAVINTSYVSELPYETVAYMAERIPMARLGCVSELAQLVAWVASPACSFTTGFTFDLSGGRASY
jgi:2-dehydro-3-deoxy-L-rhamnonate dehydrogenase (NAD+)